ncbi:MAG: nucleotidyltransferase domain-containing protein [Deltaproteobacteria bacterium]|nr:nucleotidyltransferase domain-containing protein [Deltaproteobacteria bacterium]
MNSGILPEHLKKILGILRAYPQIQEVILFGSRAKGNYREGSDIDLALKGKNLDSRLLTLIGIDYDALYLPWKLDVILYDQIENADLKDHIDRVGVNLA